MKTALPGFLAVVGFAIAANAQLSTAPRRLRALQIEPEAVNDLDFGVDLSLSLSMGGANFAGTGGGGKSGKGSGGEDGKSGKGASTPPGRRGFWMDVGLRRGRRGFWLDVGLRQVRQGF